MNDQIPVETSTDSTSGFSARQFEILARSLGALVVFLDPELRISYVSQETVAFLSGGVEADFRKLWTERLRERVRELMQPRERREVEVEIVLEPDDGVLQSCVMRVVQLAEEDCRGYLAMVSPRRAVEAARKALALASRMENLARVYRSHVHDLRAPLNAVALAVEALRGRLSKKEGRTSESDEAEYLAILEREVRRFERMLTVLLQEAAPVPRETEEEYDLVAQIEDVVTLLEPMAADRRVEIELEIPGRLRPRIRAHPDRLKQVLCNLAINGIEAMPDGGTLTFKLVEEDGGCHLLVEDTGAGVPEDLLERIWTAHFTTKEKGTGIGLTVVKSVVEALGGAVRARRLEPRGMRFEILFPATRLWQQP